MGDFVVILFILLWFVCIFLDCGEPKNKKVYYRGCTYKVAETPHTDLLAFIAIVGTILYAIFFS